MKSRVHPILIFLYLVCLFSFMNVELSFAQDDSVNLDQLKQEQEAKMEELESEETDTFLPEQTSRVFEGFSPDFGLTDSASVFYSNYKALPLTVTNDLKFYVSFFFSQSAFFYARGRNRTTWNSEPAVGQKKLKNVIDVDKLYFQLRLNTFELTIGRYQYVLGRGIVLNNNGDGFNFSWNIGPFSLQTVLIYTDWIVKDFDSFRIRTHDYSNGSKRLLGGGKFTLSFAHNQSLYLGFLYQYDFKNELQEQYRTYYALFGWDLRLTSSLFFFGEAVFEGGNGAHLPYGNLGPLVKNKITSAALDSNFQFRLGPPAYFSVTLNYAMALGDDQESNFLTLTRKVQGKNTFQATTSFYTGFSALFPAFSNIHLVRMKVDALPLHFVPILSKMYVSFYYNVYLKQNKKGISPIRIADQDETFLGQSVDILLYWRILSDLTLSVNSGVFIPGKAITDKSVKYMISSSLELWF